jgi:hypothetical protein
VPVRLRVRRPCLSYVSRRAYRPRHRPRRARAVDPSRGLGVSVAAARRVASRARSRRVQASAVTHPYTGHGVTQPTTHTHTSDHAVRHIVQRERYPDDASMHKHANETVLPRGSTAHHSPHTEKPGAVDSVCTDDHTPQLYCNLAHAPRPSLLCLFACAPLPRHRFGAL